MRTRFVFVLFLSLTALFSHGQISVKGKICDKTSGAALEYATLMVHSLPDSTFVTGGITEPNGTFKLELNKGSYLFKFQYIGYQIVDKRIALSGDKSVVDIGKISLSPDMEILDEVEVVAERSTYEMTLDKRVFNVGKDVSTTAGNAIEVLEAIPSVAVDVEGNVSLRGDDGVRILIDGKVSGLSGMSTQDALRSVQADMIERVEVITNPSVRYDAEGTAGIINIILKKDKRQGFNGSIDLRTGYPWQYGLGVSGNYRLNKFNLFASYNYNHRQNIGGGISQTRYFRDADPEQTYLITDQTTTRRMTRDGHNVRFGTDYYITDKDILTLSMVYRHATSNTNPIVTYMDSIPGLDSTHYSTREEVWNGSDPVYEVTLDYDKRFARQGQSLRANFRYFNNAELSYSDIEEYLYESYDQYADHNYASALLQKTRADEKQNNIQASVDYVMPVFKKGQFEAGAKFNYRNIESISEVSEQDDEGIYFPLSDYSYDFEYTEKVAALYASIGNEWGRWSGQAGLRGEFTGIATCLYDYYDGFDSINDNSYLNLFPSAHLNYSLTENDQFQVSYTRRIRRPGYWQLSPFRSYNDNRNIRMGNPALKPVFTDSYEFGYLRFWEKTSITFTAFYRHSTDAMRHYTFVVDDISYSMPINFGTGNDFGLEFVAQGQLLKWWNINGNLNFFRSITDGEIEGTSYHTDAYMFFGRLVSKFNVGRLFDFQVTAHYRGPRVEPLGKREGEWWMDMAASKEVLKGKGTITLNVRDVFGTRGHGGESWGDNFWRYNTNTWTKTTVSLNFNYRINQQKPRKGQKNIDDGGGNDFEGMDDM